MSASADEQFFRTSIDAVLCVEGVLAAIRDARDDDARQMILAALEDDDIDPRRALGFIVALVFYADTLQCVAARATQVTPAEVRSGTREALLTFAAESGV
jgi:hypothetical protein